MGALKTAGSVTVPVTVALSVSKTETRGLDISFAFFSVINAKKNTGKG
jgi:hypothetical protein